MVMWTMGPSFPRLRPAATESMIPIDLMSNVHLPKNPRIMKPLRIVLIWKFYKSIKTLSGKYIWTQHWPREWHRLRRKEQTCELEWQPVLQNLKPIGRKKYRLLCNRPQSRLIVQRVWATSTTKLKKKLGLFSKIMQNFLLTNNRTCEQLSPKAVWLEDQQHCSLSNQKASGQIPYFKSVIHVVPISTILATVPTERDF